MHYRAAGAKSTETVSLDYAPAMRWFHPAATPNPLARGSDFAFRFAAASRSGWRVAIRNVNGYPCRNCADVELAKRGIDPAHPQRPVAGSEVYVSREQAERNRYGTILPPQTGAIGSRLNLIA